MALVLSTVEKTRRLPEADGFPTSALNRGRLFPEKHASLPNVSFQKQVIAIPYVGVKSGFDATTCVLLGERLQTHRHVVFASVQSLAVSEEWIDEAGVG